MIIKGKKNQYNKPKILKKKYNNNLFYTARVDDSVNPMHADINDDLLATNCCSGKWPGT